MFMLIVDQIVTNFMISLNYLGISLNTVASFCFASLITIVVTRVYYIRSVKSLEKETRNICKLVSISLHALEDSGMVTLSRNKQGEIDGMVHHLKIASSFSQPVSETPTLNEIKTNKNNKNSGNASNT